MIKIKIIKDGEEYYKSPEKDIFGINFEYENEKYVEIDYDDLENADLSYANLENANLSYAYLRSANLYNADLRSANLGSANLYNADLENANLRSANLDKKELIRKGKIQDKKVIVYKKCHNKIVTLQLQIGSVVFSINNKKCRTNKVKVIAIDDDKTEGLTIESDRDNSFIYEVGKMVEVKNFDLMYNAECSTGIHFFWTKEEAESYNL